MARRPYLRTKNFGLPSKLENNRALRNHQETRSPQRQAMVVDQIMAEERAAAFAILLRNTTARREATASKGQMSVRLGGPSMPVLLSK
jgi:hypothetical protein